MLPSSQQNIVVSNLFDNVFNPFLKVCVLIEMSSLMLLCSSNPAFNMLLGYTTEPNKGQIVLV